MSSSEERRADILSYLCTVRQTTLGVLVNRFQVSKRTIQNDITALTLNYPVETVQGNGGGVRIAEWYRPDRRTLSPEQMALLKKLAPSLKYEERIVMNSIITQFGLYSR